jgi:hypothetical protein
MKHQKRVFYLTHPKMPALVHGILKMPRPSSVGGGLIGLFLFTWLSLITTLANAQPLTEESNSSRQIRSSTCHHLTNISTNASIQGGQGDTIAGFIISGTGTKRVLLRGWALDTGVNPKVTVLKFPSGDLIASNDDWQTQTPPSLTITSDMGLSNPTDAGVLLDLPAGAYTLTLSSVGNKGRGLVGVDAIETAGTPTTIKLINISTRAPILGVTGDVVAGFMISGTGMQQVLIRGWDYDSGVDTKLRVQKYPSGEVIATNDNWQTQIAPAIAIPSIYQMPKTTDAAVLLSLPAGAYTATLESVGMTGLGLIGVDAVGDESDCSSITPPPATTYYPLTISLQGSGKVTSAPAGIDCGTDCTENYVAATMVTLTATANANATFTGWSGACVGIGASTSVTLDAAKGCTATFVGTTTVSCNTTNTSCPVLDTLIPPSEGVVAWLGSGLDGDRNQLKQWSCVNGTSRTLGGGFAKLSTSLIFNYEDVLKQQIISGGGSLSIGFFNAHANAKYEEMFHQTGYSQSFLFDYVVNLGNTLFDVSSSNPLNPLAPTNDQCEFRKICGNQYVCQVEPGGKISVQMRFKFNDQFLKKDFSASAGAGIKDWKKTLCGACGSKVISISANLDAEISKLSQTTKSSGQLEITVRQEGGRPEKLVQVIGPNVTTCSLTNIASCKKVLDDVVSYVSGEGFAGSLRESPTMLNYQYCPYEQIPGVPQLNSDVTSEITTARQNLAAKYQERLAALEKVRDLLQLSLLPTRYQRLQSLEQTFSSEVEKIGQAGQGCFKALSNCLKNKCEILGSLTSYDPNELEIQLTDGLMAYYPFDMDTQDASGNGHNGNAVGLIAYVPGKRGQAASFDGNSYIQIPDTKAFQSWKNRSVTLAAWVQVVDNGDYRPFISLSDTDSLPFVGIGKWAYNYDNGGIYLHNWDHVGNILSVNSLDDGNTLPKKQWLHVVGVEDYENLQAKLYVNGVLQQVAKLGINVDMSQATSLTFLIGKFAHYPSKHYGLMDEAMIYGRALSEAEIQQLYGLNYTLNFK